MGFGAGIYRFSLILVLVGEAAWAQCPAGLQNYIVRSGKCRPDLVVTSGGELGYDADDYPVCGTNRIPVSGNGSYSITQFASTGVPNTSNTFTVPGFTTFNYTTSTTNGPIYGFEPGSRCACIGTSTHPRPMAPSGAHTNYSVLSPMLNTTTPRMYPDTADVISSQNNAATVMYGPVAIANSATGGMNGRLYAKLFGSPSTSFCGCPNFNEISGRIDTGVTLSGSVCRPGVNSTGTPEFRVLTAFNPEYHVTTLPQILDEVSAEPTVSPAPSPEHGAYVTEFQLPANTSDYTNMVTYTRKIWTCAAPYELNVTNGDCEYTAAHHACDDGTGGGPVSAYALPNPSATPDATKFNELINRKLACCLNRENNTNPESPYAKFDCVSNAAPNPSPSAPPPPTSFDELWASSDSDAQGGQLNALVLLNGAGRPVTGFYSVDGVRCGNFSEFTFGEDIQPFRLDPPRLEGQQAQVSGTPVPNGTPIPVPTSFNFSLLAGAALAAGKTSPATAMEMFQCPILVRAAIVVSCPSETVVPNAIASVTDPNDGSTRCPVASSVQIHVRIQQLYEITGRAVLPVVDTFLNPSMNQAIDVSSIIHAKYGDGCPPGTVNNHGVCSY